MAPTQSAAPAFDFAQVTSAQWQALGRRKIWFGHQSVGGNIVDGIQAVLAARPDIPVRIADLTALDSSSGPGLYHARIGRNGDPASKADVFARVTDSAHPQVAMLKFCYVDITRDTDPEALFADYQHRITALRARHLDLVVVHMTLPLTRAENWKGMLVSRLKGRTTDRELNVIRNRYNRLLLAAYAGREPVFDVARLESTHPGGTREVFSRDGDTWYAMVPAFTDDGSHLNETGRRRVAEAFLALLANL